MRKTIFHFCFIAGILCMQNAFSADSPQAPAGDNKPATKSEAPAPPKDAVQPTFADVAYGPGESQRLWFWQAKSDRPTPLIMNIHGGGWLHGPRDAFNGGEQKYLDQGISVAHITYTFSQVKPLPAPVMDAARALQFLRSKAVEWNIDPTRVILTGFSAGGATALWLATHDDLANPKSDDPVERQSTRVSGAMVGGAQTSIEPENVRQWAGQDGISHAMFRKAGGFDTNEEMFKAVAEEPEVAKLYSEFSAINHLSADDPPMMLGYSHLEIGRDGVHSGAFGLKFKEKADAVGMNKCYLEISKDPNYPGFPGGGAAFVKTVFNIQEKKN